MRSQEALRKAVSDFLVALGLDVRGAYAETPARVAKLYAEELLAGEGVDVAARIREGLLPCEGEEEIVVRNISVMTLCPHHLMPSFGTAAVAIAPRAHRVGIGAVTDVVEAFARRLILQEELGRQVASALFSHMGARWVACSLSLVHGCLVSQKRNAMASRVDTFSYSGEPEDREAARASLSP